MHLRGLRFAAAAFCVGSADAVVPGVYQLQNAETGAFLSIEADNKDNGALVLIASNGSTGLGQWDVDRFLSTSAYVLQSAMVTEKYLNAAGAPAQNAGVGSYLHLWDNPGDQNSQWFIRTVDNGDGDTVVLQNVASGAFLNLAPGNETVRLWNQPGSRRSQWILRGVVCRDTLPDEMCYQDTIWAKDYAINTRPHWYPGLTNESSFADFQAYLHHCYWERCPMPCANTTYHECGMVGRFWDNSSCSDAVATDSTCGRAIAWAMNYGIVQHPDWYPSLNVTSNAMQFQARLYYGQQLGVEPDHGCPQPCCHDTLPGERCHEDTMWATLYGINIPELDHVYPEFLTNQSAFAEFQAYLHHCYPGRCPEPCATTTFIAHLHGDAVACPNMQDESR